MIKILITIIGILICIIVSIFIGIILALKDMRKNVDIKPFDLISPKKKYRKDYWGYENKKVLN